MDHRIKAQLPCLVCKQNEEGMKYAKRWRFWNFAISPKIFRLEQNFTIRYETLNPLLKIWDDNSKQVKSYENRKRRCIVLGHPIYKGVFNLPNQLSNFCINWGANHGVKVFHEFYKLILPHFCYLYSKIAIIPPIFTRKCLNFLETSLKTMIWGN